MNFIACSSLAEDASPIRMFISSEIICMESNFIGQSSNDPGGALFINQPENSLVVELCLFMKCSSFGSILIARNCSGGAVCCSILSSKITLSNFVECFGISAGIAVYICGKINQELIFEECSASKMKTLNNSYAIYMTDYSSNTVSRANFSNSIDPTQSLFFGQNSPKVITNKIFVAGDKMLMGVGLSSGSDQTDISTIVFLDMNDSTCLFTVWNSKFTVSDIHVINCIGRLAESYGSGRLKVSNSWVGKNIEIGDCVELGSGVFREDSSLPGTLFVEHKVIDACSKNIKHSPKLISLFCHLILACNL